MPKAKQAKVLHDAETVSAVVAVGAAAIEAEVQKLLDAGKPVPRHLEIRLLSALAREQEDNKTKAMLYERIAKLRDRDEKAGLIVAEVPKEALAAIAGFKLRGITPYSPSME